MAEHAATAELTESPRRQPGQDRKSPASQRPALIVGILIVVTLSGLVGSTGIRVYQAHRAQQQRALFLDAARRAAVNLTTVDFREADADVQRILSGATGQLYDNFAERSQPFIDVVLRTQSKTVGTVTAAGIESQSGERAQVLVAVTVHTSNAEAPQQEPHAWRMRLLVQKVDRGAKVSNVEFVP